MKSILLDNNRKVVFDDANKAYAEATIYQLRPFLFWNRWVRICSVFLEDHNYRLRTKKEIIKDLTRKADFRVRMKIEADSFNMEDCL